MVKPSANNSQVLVWRPKNGKSVCVVPAKESFKESNPITIFKGGNTMARKPHMIRQLTEEVRYQRRVSTDGLVRRLPDLDAFSYIFGSAPSPFEIRDVNSHG